MYILALTCQYPACQGTRPCGDGARAGRTRAGRPGNAPEAPAGRCRADRAASRAGQARITPMAPARRPARRAGSIWRVSESFPELAQAVLEHAQPDRIDIVRAKRHLLGQLGDGQPHPTGTLIASSAGLGCPPVCSCARGSGPAGERSRLFRADLMAGLAAFGGTCDTDEFFDDDAEPDDRDHQSSQAIQSLPLSPLAHQPRIIEKGRARLTLFPCDTSACTGRDRRARAVPLPSAISKTSRQKTQTDRQRSQTPSSRAVRAMAEGSIHGTVCNGISDGNHPARAADVQLTITGPKPAIVGLLTRPANAQDLIESGALTADGDISTPDTLASVMEDIDPPSTSRPRNQPQSGSLRRAIEDVRAGTKGLVTRCRKTSGEGSPVSGLAGRRYRLGACGSPGVLRCRRRHH